VIDKCLAVVTRFFFVIDNTHEAATSLTQIHTKILCSRWVGHITLQNFRRLPQRFLKRVPAHAYPSIVDTHYLLIMVRYDDWVLRSSCTLQKPVDNFSFLHDLSLMTPNHVSTLTVHVIFSSASAAHCALRVCLKIML
jgi:hypothetical protein